MPARLTRRRLLRAGLGGLAGVLVGGGVAYELVDHGVLPGKQELDTLTGACSVASPPLRLAALGPSTSGSFYSSARHTTVGYTIAWPPGHAPGDPLPLIVMLHGYGANHRDALSSMTPEQAVAVLVDGVPLAPVAMVTVDGGPHYWNPHPGDDPMAMVVDEMVPRCQQLALGQHPQRIGLMGISMGGYGALLLGERFPDLFAAVGAISPAVWLTYPQAHEANAGAFASAADFADDDVVTHAHALTGRPVRVTMGSDDPFYPDFEVLTRALPRGSEVVVTGGCHGGSFFVSQEPPTLAFLAAHLSGPSRPSR